MRTGFRIVLCAALLSGCASEPPVVMRQNKATIYRYFDEWANHGNAKAADELIAPNLILRNPPAELRSLDEYKKSMTAFHTAFPDLHFTVEDMVSEGDKVVVRWSLHATQRGIYQGRPATGKTISITGMSLFRLAGGKIQEIDVSLDRHTMLQQLGWLP